MKKITKIIVLLLCASLMLTFVSCQNTDESKAESKAEQSEQTSETEVSQQMSNTENSIPEESTTTSEPEIERDWPIVTGSFVQLGAFTSYTQAKWEKHFDYLLEVGIDTFILQWTATTPYGKFGDAYYPASPSADEKASGYKEYPNVTENVLKAAEKKGMKVFVGLNLADEWWTTEATKPDWYRNQANTGKKIAHDLYDLYKEKYPNAFHGWYFAWEYYNGIGYVEQVSDLLNLYLDELTVIDPSMPMLLSPFVRSSVSVAKTESEWKEIFALARFRDGDIFCLQDSVGAGHITIDQMDGYFAAMKKACDTEEGLIFWANNEDFTQSDWSSAPVSRFVRQMEISSKYVTGHVTFAYSHYYAPDMGKKKYHDAYKEYYETGIIPD